MSETGKKFEVRSPDVEFAIIGVFCGDNDLSLEITNDLREMARVTRGSISVLALVDFLNRPGEVIEIVPGHPEHRLLDEPPAGAPDINLGDPKIIEGFLIRALNSYSASTRKAIGFAGHGTGIMDRRAFAPNLGMPRNGGIAAAHRINALLAAGPPFVRVRNYTAPVVDEMGASGNADELTNAELNEALTNAFAQTNTRRVDLIFFDSCNNGLIEVMDQVRDFADVVIGSEAIEPDSGWQYTAWLEKMAAYPPATSDDWGRSAVRAFKESWNGQTGSAYTLGAFRADQEITARFRELIDASRSNEGFNLLARARQVSKSFKNRPDDPPELFDIKHFAENLLSMAARGDAVHTVCSNLLRAFDDAYLDSVALPEAIKGANGLAFWFPEFRFQYDRVKGTYKDLRFNQETRWLEYLGQYSFGIAPSH
jgi:hypothetical protein